VHPRQAHKIVICCSCHARSETLRAELIMQLGAWYECSLSSYSTQMASFEVSLTSAEYSTKQKERYWEELCAHAYQQRHEQNYEAHAIVHGCRETKAAYSSSNVISSDEPVFSALDDQRNTEPPCQHESDGVLVSQAASQLIESTQGDSRIDLQASQIQGLSVQPATLPVVGGGNRSRNDVQNPKADMQHELLHISESVEVNVPASRKSILTATTIYRKGQNQAEHVQLQKQERVMHMAVQFGFEKMAQRALDIWHSVLLCRCIQIEKATIDFRWKQLKQSWKAWRHCAECAQATISNSEATGLPGETLMLIALQARQVHLTCACLRWWQARAQEAISKRTLGHERAQRQAKMESLIKHSQQALQRRTSPQVSAHQQNGSNQAMSFAVDAKTCSRLIKDLEVGAKRGVRDQTTSGAQSNDSSSPFCSNTRAACPKWSDNADFLQHTCHQGGKPYICEALVSNQNKCCVLSKDLPKPGSNTPVEAVFIQPSKPRVINPGKKVHPEHLWTRQSSKSVSALVPRSKFCVCKDGNASSRSKNNLICLSGGNDNETNLGVRCDACQAAMGVGPRRICAEVLHERQVKGSALPLDTPKTAMEVRATQRREQRQLLRDKYKRKEEQRVRDLALIEANKNLHTLAEKRSTRVARLRAARTRQKFEGLRVHHLEVASQQLALAMLHFSRALMIRAGWLPWRSAKLCSLLVTFCHGGSAFGLILVLVNDNKCVFPGIFSVDLFRWYEQPYQFMYMMTVNG